MGAGDCVVFFGVVVLKQNDKIEFSESEVIYYGGNVDGYLGLFLHWFVRNWGCRL